MTTAEFRVTAHGESVPASDRRYTTLLFDGANGDAAAVQLARLLLEAAENIRSGRVTGKVLVVPFKGVAYRKATECPSPANSPASETPER